MTNDEDDGGIQRPRFERPSSGSAWEGVELPDVFSDFRAAYEEEDAEQEPRAPAEKAKATE